MFRIIFLIVLCAVVWPSIVLAADNAPSQTGAFLAYCKTNSDGCADKIAGINFAMLVAQPMDKNKKWCPTNETYDVKVLTPKVVQWLTAHPEAQSTKTDDGIRVALGQLYPCKG